MPDARVAHKLEDLPTGASRMVSHLRTGLVEVFRDDLAAIWLYGSILFGPHYRDLDMHIVLRRTPTADETAEIDRLHASLGPDERWQDHLDAWYVLLEDARSPRKPENQGPWHLDLVDEHWALHRAHWLAGATIVVHGLEPSTVVSEPTWSELKAALLGEIYHEARDGGGQPGCACSPYWTLQLCRVLASLETLDVVRSKLDSGEWALGRLPSKTRPIIEAAMRYYSRDSLPADDTIIRTDYPDFYALVRPLIDEAGAR